MTEVIELPVPPIVPQNAVYTSCWCEENIYLLGRHFLENQDDFIANWDAYVVVISNENKSVAICQAKSCSNPDLIPGHSAVVWDYHVVLIVSSKSIPSTSWVYDFDSRLPMGCSFGEYIRRTFPSEILLSTRFQSWFRIVELQNFIDYFVSDRSHMLRSMSDDHEEDSGPMYMMPPPSYPSLQGPLAQSTNNLFSNYVDMRPSDLLLTPELCEVNSEKLKAARYGIVVPLGIIQLLFSS